LRAYTLRVFNTPSLGYNPLDYLVGRTSTECSTNTNTNTTLHCLSIITTSPLSKASIVSLQISSTFTGLRALFLANVCMTPWQKMSLPVLEVLYTCLLYDMLWEGILDVWDMPALLHAHLGHFTTHVQFVDVLNGFLGRYVCQLESLVFIELCMCLSPGSFMQLPPVFWEQFPVLCVCSGLKVFKQDDRLLVLKDA